MTICELPADESSIHKIDTECIEIEELVKKVEPHMDAKTIYATAKVLDAIKDHEELIQPRKPKSKAKIVVLGNSGVGKTSLVYRHRFSNSLPVNTTIGACFTNQDVSTPTVDVSLQIWDTAGQERFRCMVPMYMRNATAAIIVYDVTDKYSFDDTDRWLNELHHCCGMVDPVIVLVGNKADLEERRQVSVAEGVAKALRLNARFYELGCDHPLAFNQVLDELANDLVTGAFACHFDKSFNSPLSLSPPPPEDDRIVVEEEKAPTEKWKKKGCCSLL